MAQGELFARRLLTGAAGCGKTHAVLELFRDAWHAGHAAQTILVVPTLSFREHTRNALLRMNPGAVLEGRAVVTLEELLPPKPDFSPARRDLLVERILTGAAIPHFQSVRDFAGFREMLADEADYAIEHDLRLRADSPLARAFADFLGRYSRATVQFRRQASSTVRPALLLVDGFADFTPTQKQALAQLSASAARTVVTLPLYSRTAREMLTRELGFLEEVMTGNHRGTPVTETIVCNDRRDEVDYVAGEIQRLVREQNLPFRDIGLIVQNPAAYLPTIGDVFRGADIPVRMFFPVDAAETSLGRHLLACLRFLRAEPATENAAALAVLKSAWAPSDSGDVARMEFQAVAGTLARVPLEIKRSAPRTIAQMAQAVLDCWESLTHIRELRPSFSHARALELRADALTRRRAWEIPGQVADAARAEGVSLDFPKFISMTERELARLRFRVRDRRTDAVNVMNAYEARQWELRAVFVMGLVEGEFPRPPQSTLFLPDTSAEQVREQESLYQTAVTRARAHLTLTLPRRDARGVVRTASRFVDVSRAVQAPVKVRVAQEPRPSLPTLQLPAALAEMRARETRFSASSLKYFTDCAFKHFASYRMKLEGRPKQERGLTPDILGTIVHESIHYWDRHNRATLLATIFEQQYARHTRHLSLDHNADKLHDAVRRDLEAFEKFEQTRGDTHRTRVDPDFVEKTFHFPLTLENGDEVHFTGRVDRVETGESNGQPVGLAVDYKYKVKPYTRKPLEDALQNEFQAAMYLLALGQWNLQPAGVEFHNLRGYDKRRVGVIEQSMTRDILNGSLDRSAIVQPLAPLMDAGRARMAAAALQIRAGVIAVEPRETGRCHYGQGGCEFYDLCRIPKRKVL